MAEDKTLLELKEISIDFATAKGRVRAIDSVSLIVREGETIGLVGESGCGKSVTSLSVLRLLPEPPAIRSGGQMLFRGQDLWSQSERMLRSVRGKDVSMIFQEPMTALNPVYTIKNQMQDVICQHQKMSRKNAGIKAVEMLEMVGIPSPEIRVEEYPHQMSGGMRQRVMIAIALSCQPSLLIADEPTTALDVTTQAQVLQQMKELQDKLGMATIMVTHDLGVVAQTCQRVVVMYCGQIIEQASTHDIFHRPRHPYTLGLLKSVPRIRDEKLSRLPVIEGQVPDLHHLPKGCRFSGRCPNVRDHCLQQRPELERISEDHQVACFNPVEAGGAYE